jgi:hypothetical protein
MILNEQLRFDNADATVKRAFLGTPDRVCLRPPDQLYRWTSRPLINGDRISPWWSFVHTRRLPSGALAEGFRVSEERAKRIGRTHREFARARAAISGEFQNDMTTLLLVELTQPVWAFAGTASGQREFGPKKIELQHVYLIGGAHQVWVPNLTRRCVRQISTLA